MSNCAISRQDAARELVARIDARSYLMSFCDYTIPSYEHSQHLDQIAKKLESVENGDIKRLMIFAPPRHGKSELTSIRFPAWYLGRNPQAQVIGCSYAESLAYSNSYAIRTCIESPQYQRLWSIDLDRSGAVRWQLAGKENNRASYIASGIGGGITGEGADLLIIDDPIKNRQDAESETVRDNIWGWYRTVARTRLQPNGAIVLIMTRWHQDDLAGRLLAQAEIEPDADKWEVLHLQASDQGNAQGEALWPSRYPVTELRAIKATIGSRDYTSLYDGSPEEAEGNIFKREWWRFYRKAPEQFIMLVYSWDTAFKAKEENDYSVGLLWGVTKEGYYLLDVWRDRVEYPELKKAVVFGYDYFKPQAVLVEDKASGQSLIQELKRETRIPLLPISVDADKVSRAHAVTPLIEAGNVWLPETAPWLNNYLNELSAFPSGKHDDQVDATTQFLNWVTNRREYGFSVV